MANLNKLTQQIHERLGILEQTRQDVVDVNKETSKAILDANKTAQQQVQPLNQQADNLFKDAESAFQNIERAAALPEGIRTLIGIFDSDFNIQTQQTRLDRTRFGLSAIQHRQGIIESTRDATIRNAEVTQAATQNVHTITREGFLDTAMAVDLNIKLSENIRKELVQKVESASDEDIKTWLKDPAKVPGPLRQHAGLIELEDLRRRATSANVNLSEFSLTQLTEKRDLQNFVRGIDGVDKLKEFVKDPSKLPPELQNRVGDIEEELQRREGVIFNLESAAALVSQRNMELATKARETALSRMSTDDVQDLLNSDPNARVITLELPSGNTMQFSRPELVRRLTAATTEEQAADKAVLENGLAQTAILTAQNQFETASQNLGQLMAPGVPDPQLSDFPRDMQAVLVNAEGRNQALKAFAEKGSRAALQMQAENYAAATKVMQERTEQIIKEQYKDTSQPFVREFLDRDGRPVNQDNASAYLLDNATNEVAMANNIVLDFPYRNFAEALQPLVKDKSLKLNKDGSIDFKGFLLGGGFDTNTPPAAVIQQAVKDSGFIRDYVSNATQEMLRQATLFLLEKTEGPLNDEFKKLINIQTGSLPASYLDTETVVDSNGEVTEKRKFSFTKFLSQTSLVSLNLQNQGILGANETVQDMIIDTSMLLIRQGYLQQMFKSDPLAAALNLIIFNNDPNTPIVQQLQMQQRKGLAVFSNVQSDQQRLKDMTDRIIKSPGVLEKVMQ